MIPHDKSGSSKLELLVADPEEGLHLLYNEDQVYQDENEKTYFRDLTDFMQDENLVAEPLGKIERFALNAKKDLLAIYSNSDEGDLIVLSSNLAVEINRLRTSMVGA